MLGILGIAPVADRAIRLNVPVPHLPQLPLPDHEIVGGRQMKNSLVQRLLIDIDSKGSFASFQENCYTFIWTMRDSTLERLGLS